MNQRAILFGGVGAIGGGAVGYLMRPVVHSWLTLKPTFEQIAAFCTNVNALYKPACEKSLGMIFGYAAIGAFLGFGINFFTSQTKK
jgi:hypothetical protein